jgi:hypothetical protein
MPEGRRRVALETAAQAIFADDFNGRVLPFDAAAAMAYADIFAARRRAGRPTAPLDLMIAAVARANGAGVVTRDIGGFERLRCPTCRSVAGFTLKRPPQDRPRRQENVRGRRAWARGRRGIQSLRRLCTPSLTLPRLRGREGWGPGLSVARRQTRRCLRVLRGRYQGRGTAPVLLERRQFGERAPARGHVHRQHRTAPRHGRRTAGQASGRDRAGGVHHAQQWRLDHVRQKPELTGCDTGDHRLAAITFAATCSGKSAWGAAEGRLGPNSREVLGPAVMVVACGCFVWINIFCESRILLSRLFSSFNLWAGFVANSGSARSVRCG